ncbi:MAG: sugar phosphate isomerase/epimerase [Candidatus Methanomethylophilaceae archaeon]|nr:sugar phosphate isomerase/epimerase [Candidatus Methanomethylophilaceae archaeon]
MKTGISCVPFAAEPPGAILERVSAEFRHWEIFSEIFNSVSYNFDIFKDLLPSYDLSYSVHAPIFNINLSATSELIRKASLEETLRTMRAASGLGIKTVTIHPGSFSIPVPELDEQALRLSRESLEIIDKEAAEYGIIAAVENMPLDHIPPLIGVYAEQLEKLLEGTDLSVCFDIGHAHTAGQTDAMIALSDRIANVHIHDNLGDRDSHMTVGDGNIDFRRIVRGLSGYSGKYIIESRTYESAAESQSRLEKMFS